MIIVYISPETEDFYFFFQKNAQCTNNIVVLKHDFGSWRDDGSAANSVCAQGQEFISQHPHDKPGNLSMPVAPALTRVKPGKQWGLLGFQHGGGGDANSSLRKRPCLKRKGQKCKRTPGALFWPQSVHKVTHTYAHIQTHMNTQNTYFYCYVVVCPKIKISFFSLLSAWD